MKLLLKVNLALIVVFLIGLFASYRIANDLLLENAQSEIRGDARIMMESALAVRQYTVSQIKPLLDTQQRYQFLPQTVPSYSATEYFNNLRKTFPEYSYKEATLNPTNLRDRAVDWEVDVIRRFKDDPDAKELIGERDSATGKVLWLARPLRILDMKCLQCHSDVASAPQTLIDRYGTANGFGWQFHDVIGAQVVSAPLRPAHSARASRAEELPVSARGALRLSVPDRECAVVRAGRQAGTQAGHDCGSGEHGNHGRGGFPGQG